MKAAGTIIDRLLIETMRLFRAMITILCMIVLRDFSTFSHAKTEKGISFYCIIVIMGYFFVQNPTVTLQ